MPFNSYPSLEKEKEIIIIIAKFMCATQNYCCSHLSPTCTSFIWKHPIKYIKEILRINRRTDINKSDTQYYITLEADTLIHIKDNWEIDLQIALKKQQLTQFTIHDKHIECLQKQQI